MMILACIMVIMELSMMMIIVHYYDFMHYMHYHHDDQQGVLTQISRSTKSTLNRLGVFTVSSLHAYICARSPRCLFINIITFLILPITIIIVTNITIIIIITNMIMTTILISLLNNLLAGRGATKRRAPMLSRRFPENRIIQGVFCDWCPP